MAAEPSTRPLPRSLPGKSEPASDTPGLPAEAPAAALVEVDAAPLDTGSAPSDTGGPPSPVFLIVILAVVILIARGRAPAAPPPRTAPHGEEAMPDGNGTARYGLLGLGRLKLIGILPVSRSFWQDEIVALGPHAIQRSAFSRQITSVGGLPVEEGMFSFTVDGKTRKELRPGSFAAAVAELVAADRSERQMKRWRDADASESRRKRR